MVEDCRTVDEGFALLEHQRGYTDQGIESTHLIRVAENREQSPRKGDYQHLKGDDDTARERRIVVADETPDHALPPCAKRGMSAGRLLLGRGVGWRPLPLDAKHDRTWRVSQAMAL